ncbi:MAG TPA: UvrD-helicase domain-containing protein [Candidatus Dormibacteraeota bacterium]
MSQPQPEHAPATALDTVLEGLNPPQREAVEHGDGPLLIFAGAGSGKTRVLTTRIAYLVERRRVFPERLLAVTFTNKAAREMRARVGTLLGDDDRSRNMWVGTFHATAVKLLRREAKTLELAPSFVIFDEDDTRAALKRVLDDLRLDQKRYPPATISHRISQAKNELQGPDELPNNSYADEIVRRCYAGYETVLRRSGGLDFDDLILYSVRLFRDHADALERWQDRWRHVLVDEYQDTNHAQYVLVNLVASGHRNIAVVGDDDQSVYGWRGADVRNILEFRRDYPDAKVVKLEQNYRSTQPILDAAFQVIRHNEERAEKRLWTDRTGGDKVTATQAYNEVEEAEFAADEVERLRRAEGRKYAEFAVLYRTNAQSRAFEDVFNRRRIPYRLVGGVRFWERREIKDVLAYLRFLFNPADEVSFARIVNVPRRKIGPVTVEALRAHAASGAGSLLDGLASPAAVPGLPKAALAPLEHFHRQLASIQAVAAALPPSDLVQQVVDVMGLEQHYLDGTPQGEARMENVEELRGLAEEFDEQGPEAGLEAFLTEVALVSDVDAYDEGEEGVTLITLHMVKGLEFPVVFLAGMEEGLLPHSRSIDDGPAGIAEERRLCYVGMTRAKDRLYLSCSFRRHLFGQSSASSPSRFLHDIPPSLMAAPRRGAAPAPPPRSSPGAYRDRMLQRQVQAAPAPPPKQRYRAGDRVKHPAFGSGEVMKSTLTRTDEELLVRFEKGGLKILSGSLAPLEKQA